MRVIASDFLAIYPRRDHGRGVHCVDALQEAGRIERFISNDGTDILHSINQVLGLGDVMPLSTGQSKPGEVAQSVDGRMNLGAQSPTRTAKTLFSVFFEAPAACWCARTIVLSRNTSSKSASSHSVAKMACQTSRSAKVLNS